MKKRNKKAEGFLGMGFGMIFSIFLIIIFIAVAIYAIGVFVNFSKCSQIGMFMDKLQNEINTAFNSQYTEKEFPGQLPSNLKYVCFANFSKSIKGDYEQIGEDLERYSNDNHNMFFYPRQKACTLPSKFISHINITSISKTDNPNCFQIVNGKVKIKILKGFNEGLVKLQ